MEYGGDHDPENQTDERKPPGRSGQLIRGHVCNGWYRQPGQELSREPQAAQFHDTAPSTPA
jgi:hypothetical protein